MTGHYAYLVQQRDAILSTTRVSAADRARIAGRSTPPPAAPVKTAPQPTLAAVSARLAALTIKVTEKETALAELDALIALRKRQLGRMAGKADVERGPGIIDVQRVFCDRLRGAGYMVEGRPYSFNDLICRTNHTPHVEPRHVCIDLVRRLTTQTLITIATAFSYGDHTAVKYALGKTPHYLANRPMLANVHAKVLAHFGAQK